VRKRSPHLRSVTAAVTLSVAAVAACTPSTGPPTGVGPTVAVTKAPDAVRVAVVGDSLLAPDCYGCSPFVVPTYGGAEEVRPVLDGDPNVDLISYSGVATTTLASHPDLARAIAMAPQELIIDLHVNDAFQVALGTTSLATVKAAIDRVLDDAAAAGVECVRWISYPTRWAGLGVWSYTPGARNAFLALAAHVRAAVAARPGRAAMIEWGPMAEQISEQGVAVIDPRDNLHYLNTIAPTFGEYIRRSIGSAGCGDPIPEPTTTTTTTTVVPPEPEPEPGSDPEAP
jgi:hypothetical protein